MHDFWALFLTTSKDIADILPGKRVPNMTHDVVSGLIHWMPLQVLIPTVGYAVKLPNNEMAEWYAEMLQEDGLSMDNMSHNQK